MTTLYANQTIEQASWVTACRVNELEDWWGAAFRVRERLVAVYRAADGRVFAADQRDPRTGSPVMARGVVGPWGDRVVVASPATRAIFDLATGECLSGEDLTLSVFPARVSEGNVEVVLDEVLPEAQAS